MKISKFRNPDPVERLLDSVHPWQREEYEKYEAQARHECLLDMAVICIVIVGAFIAAHWMYVKGWL